jgi:hypothetical protein
VDTGPQAAAPVSSFFFQHELKLCFSRGKAAPSESRIIKKEIREKRMQENEVVGTFSGLAAGAAAGALIGARIGISLGPWGALAGTIPGAVSAGC